MARIERDRELAQRRQRKAKLLKLIAKFAFANGADKEVIAAKVRRISPTYDLEGRVKLLKEAGKLVAPKKK